MMSKAVYFHVCERIGVLAHTPPAAPPVAMYMAWKVRRLYR